MAELIRDSPPFAARSGRKAPRAAIAMAGIILTACAPAQSATTTTATTTTVTVPTTTSPPPRDCTPRKLHNPTVPENAATFSLEISRAVFSCAEEVVLSDTEPGAAWTAAVLAVSKEAPLLVVDGPMTGAVASELKRLGPAVVYLVGLDDLDPSLFGGYQVERRQPRAPRPYTPEVRSPDPHRIWLVTDPHHAGAAIAWAAARTVGDSLIAATDPDPRLLPDAYRGLLTSSLPVITVGEVSEDFGWQLEVVKAGTELPGGGQVLFDDRRLVALYGNPTTPNLGVLGEQGPQEAVTRLLEIAEPYSADGLEVLPAFEIIATVASAVPGRGGDYSEEMSLEVLRPWIEVAAEGGVYVILDLQPGRTDFLTQAKYYEEFLRLPHVGLALDPEWRLKPNQVHLRQIGSVDASEINQVSEWMAGIVREEALPQKLFLLHQFKLTMITNRELIETPSELAVVIQMDGQGPLATKYSTWNALTAATEDAGWRWGWKNFYDEDSPMATPSEVLNLEPKVVYVSFQ